MTDTETYIEISNLVFAGSGKELCSSLEILRLTELCHLDTTSTTLTYLFWELAQHPEWQGKLRSEVSKDIKWTDNLPNFKDIGDLSLLDAVIHEALRLHPAAPASLPRETPAGGRMLNGILIPEKVCPVPVANSMTHIYLTALRLDHCFDAMLYHSTRS